MSVQRTTNDSPPSNQLSFTNLIHSALDSSCLSLYSTTLRTLCRYQLLLITTTLNKRWLADEQTDLFDPIDWPMPCLTFLLSQAWRYL